MKNRHLPNEFNLNENIANVYPLSAKQPTAGQQRETAVWTDARDKLAALSIALEDNKNRPFYEAELVELLQSFTQNLAILKAKHPTAIVQKNEPRLVSNLDKTWLDDFENFVRVNLSETDLSVPMVARNFAMSESSLYRQLMRLLGVAPNQYLLEKRLLKAHHLLSSGDHRSITFVATQVGYSDLRAFSRRFKKRFGYLPSNLLNN